MGKFEEVGAEGGRPLLWLSALFRQPNADIYDLSPAFCRNCAFHLTKTKRNAFAESFSNIYGYSMAVAAPGFGLAVLGLGPGTLHWWGYLLLWAACSSAIAALVHHKLSKTGLGYASRCVCTKLS